MGDGEIEPNAEQISQLALEVCKEDVITLIVHKMSILGWEVSYGDFTFSRPVMRTTCWIAQNDVVSLILGKKGFGSLLVHIVEAKSWLHILLCGIHREPFGVT